VQDSQGQADHLQILTSGGGGNIAWLGAHIVDNSSLQPRNQKMCSLVDNLLLHTRHSVEDDSSSSALHIIEGGVGDDNSRSHGNSQAVDVVETVSRHCLCESWRGGVFD